MKQQADTGLVPAHRGEADLLRWASRLRMEQQTTDQIRAALRCDVDWNWLVRTSLDHGVTALMFHSLLRVGGDLLPEEIAAGANEFLRAQRETNRQRGGELLRILVALEKSGIPALPFKGPVLAQDVYEDIGLRSFEDLDFLVHQKDVPRCLDVLRDLHYEIEADYDIRPNLYYGHDLFLQTGFAAVEPHWRVAPSFVALRIDHAGMWKRARRARLLDTEVSTFSAEDSLVFLCIHGSKHEWYKLQWISDVAETIRAYKQLNWSSVIENSGSRGCLRMVLLGSALARCQLGAEIPHNVELLIRADPVLETLTSQVVEALLSGDCRPRGGPKLTRFNLRVREQLRDKVAFVAACIFLPRRLHFRLVPLPGPISSLCAFPIKLLYDYCATPLWRLVKWFINGRCRPARRAIRRRL